MEDPFPIDGRSPVLRSTNLRCRCDEKIYPIPTVFFSPVLRKKIQFLSLSLSLSLRKNQIEYGRKQQKYIVALCYVVSRRINTPLDLLTALFLLLVVCSTHPVDDTVLLLLLQRKLFTTFISVQQIIYSFSSICTVNVTNSPSLTAFESEFWRSPLLRECFSISTQTTQNSRRVHERRQ